MPKEVLINFERCLGCLSCKLACATAHSRSGDLFKAVLEGERPKSRVFVHQMGKVKAPLNCRHCQEAPCIDACIAGAMHRKEDGTVTNAGGEQECTGCWMCVMVCPYGVIRSDEEGLKALKCDRECRDEAGLPACVRACPTGALVYAEVDEYSSRRRVDFLERALRQGI
ncbi:MAG: 4Fe-4S dicluster domain-containing protein [Moorellaceae bacterium]